MIRIALVLLMLFTLSGCGEDGPSASAETSPGGIEFTLLQLPDNKDVSIQIAWPSDWAYRADTNKAAPLVGVELILAGGAEGYAAGAAAERFADLNSEANIFVSVQDEVIGTLTFERDNMEETIAIANAHLRAPSLDPEWFDRVRGGLSANYAEARAKTINAVMEVGRRAVFHDAPLRNALSMDEAGVFDRLTREDVIAWHAETFTRSPAAVVVAGGITAAEAGAALDALLAGLPEAGRAMSRQAEADFSPRRILLHLPDAEASELVMIAPLPPTAQGNEMEDLILLAALGGGDQSVLFKTVREELRASYDFGAGLANFTRDHRFFYLGGEVETAKLAEVERAVRKAYADFRRDGPTADLAALKAPYEASLTELPDFVHDLAHAELQNALDGGTPGRALRLVDDLNAVTEDSLKDRLASAFPDSDGFLVIAASPDPDALPGSCVITRSADAGACR